MNRSRSTSQQYRQKAMRILLALVLISLTLPAVAHAEPIKPAALRITIDPGHGGGYSGAYYNGIAEKTLNLQISLKLASELERRGYDVGFTRTSDRYVWQGGSVATWQWISSANEYRYDYYSVDDYVDRLRRDLQSRCDVALAQGSDLFISIHNNAGGSAQGAETYRAPQDPLGQQFATDMQAELVAETGAYSRGVFAENFYVIRWSNMPAVLVECGFMSNSYELARLRTSSYQWKIARGLADGVDRFAAREFNESFDRIWGEDRYETAAEVARAGWSDPDTVILASGEAFADSLVAGPYAYQIDAPIVLTEAGRLPRAIEHVLGEMSPERLIVVGGPASVSETVAVEAALASGIDTATPGAFVRMGGVDRYGTSLLIAEAMGVADDAPVVLASGESFPDALGISASAAASGEPIMLVASTGMTNGTRAYVERGDRGITVVGGTSVVPDEVMQGFSYERIAGSDRYATNWQIFSKRYSETERLSPILASGENFPDALVIGAYAGRQDRPILLVGKTKSTKSLRPWVYNHRNDSLDVDVVGGPASVSAYISQMFEKWRMNSH